MPKTSSFDKYSEQYENWFVENEYVFKSELEAIKQLLPKGKRTIEIGIGSGIFAEKLNITEGVEPSKAMRERAKKRNINVLNAVAENLPYPNKSIETILIITTICFVDDIYKSFSEAHRILKQNGTIIIAFVDKNSPLGKIYLQKKEKSLFYKEATFYSTTELIEILKITGFKTIATKQTIFGEISKINKVQEVLEGHGKGSFVVIKANLK